jgi:hypothetical protein
MKKEFLIFGIFAVLVFSLVGVYAQSDSNLIKCYDSDGGNNPLIPGFLIFRGNTYGDSCSDGITKEYFCTENENVMKWCTGEKKLMRIYIGGLLDDLGFCVNSQKQKCEFECNSEGNACAKEGDIFTTQIGKGGYALPSGPGPGDGVTIEYWEAGEDLGPSDNFDSTISNHPNVYVLRDIGLSGGSNTPEYKPGTIYTFPDGRGGVGVGYSGAWVEITWGPEDLQNIWGGICSATEASWNGVCCLANGFWNICGLASSPNTVSANITTAIPITLPPVPCNDAVIYGGRAYCATKREITTAVPTNITTAVPTTATRVITTIPTTTTGCNCLCITHLNTFPDPSMPPNAYDGACYCGDENGNPIPKNPQPNVVGAMLPVAGAVPSPSDIWGYVSGGYAKLCTWKNSCYYKGVRFVPWNEATCRIAGIGRGMDCEFLQCQDKTFYVGWEWVATGLPDCKPTAYNLYSKCA